MVSNGLSEGASVTRDEKDGRPDPPPRANDAESSRVESYLLGDRDTVREIDSWIRAGVQSRYPVLRREIDDVCQIVHERLLLTLRLDRFRGSSSLRTYVTGILHHVAIDIIRKRWRDAPLEAAMEGRRTPLSPDNPYESLASLERRHLLHYVLQRVPEVCRTLWKLVFVERLSYSRIGERLDLPPGTVKSRMWHCRAKALALARRLSHRRNVRTFRPRSPGPHEPS